MTSTVTESQVTHDGSSAGVANNTSANMTAPLNFWDARCLRNEMLKELRITFSHVLNNGAPETIPGVQHCALQCRVDNTVRFFTENANTTGNCSYMEWKTEKVSGQDAWDKFSRVAPFIEAQWPETLTRADRYSESCIGGASVHLKELSRDQSGVQEQINKCLTCTHVVPTLATNVGTFGRYWRFSPRESHLNIPLLAFILSLATLGHNEETSGIGYCGAVFPLRYAGIWPETNWTRWCCLDNRVCHMQFHIRYFSAAMLRSSHEPSEGLLLSREVGRFSSVHAKYFESRSAIAMNTTLDSDITHYSMTMLVDHDTNRLDHVGESDGIKLGSDKKFIGITVFQVAILHLLNEANMAWADFFALLQTVLDEIDEFNLAEREKATSSFILQESKLKSVLADLRTAEDWINKTMEDLESLVKDASSKQRITPKVVQLNWRTLVSHQKIAKKHLAKQVEQKRAETQSLLNGLNNTTPLMVTPSAVSSSSEDYREQASFFKQVAIIAVVMLFAVGLLLLFAVSLLLLFAMSLLLLGIYIT